MAETLSTNFLTQTMGPLPIWGWALLGVGGAVLVSKFRTKPAKEAPTTAVTTPTSLTGVPDFITQNYITVPGMQNPTQPATPPGQPGPTPTPSGPTPSPPTHVTGHPIPGGPIVHVPPSVPTPTPSPTTPVPSAPVDTRTPGQKWDDWTDPITYTVKTGDTLSGIAAKYGLTWWDLWWYNTQTDLRPASTRATIISRGPNTAGYAGSTWLIPAKGKIAAGGHA